MVVCFLIHTVCPVSALSAGESRILYSRLFGPEELSLLHQTPEQQRLAQKETLGLVASVCRVYSGQYLSKVLQGRNSGEPQQGHGWPRLIDARGERSWPVWSILTDETLGKQVRSAVSATREASGRVFVEAGLGEEATALSEAEYGVLSLAHREPFAGQCVALWLGVQSLAFTLVCQPHENLLLAEGTLRNLTRHCLEELRLLGPGSEVLLKSDRVDAMLQRFLPHGQLLFLNHRFAHTIDKELSSYIGK